jgi:hypothetical protein
MIQESSIENAWFYGTTSEMTNEEVFAEFGAGYILNPEVMQENFPEVYSFFQDLYLGREYTTEQNSDGLYEIQFTDPE